MELYLGNLEIEGSKNKSKVYIDIPDMKSIHQKLNEKVEIKLEKIIPYKKIKDITKNVIIKDKIFSSLLDTYNILNDEFEKVYKIYNHNFLLYDILELLIIEFYSYGNLEFNIIETIQPLGDCSLTSGQYFKAKEYNEYSRLKNLSYLLRDLDINILKAKRDESLKICKYTDLKLQSKMHELSEVVNVLFSKVYNLDVNDKIKTIDGEIYIIKSIGDRITVYPSVLYTFKNENNIIHLFPIDILTKIN